MFLEKTLASSLIFIIGLMLLSSMNNDETESEVKYLLYTTNTVSSSTVKLAKIDSVQRSIVDTCQDISINDRPSKTILTNNEFKWNNIRKSNSKPNYNKYGDTMLSVTGVRMLVTPHVLKEKLIELGCKHVEVVVRQAILESECGRSNLAKTRHNLFGMRPAQRRPSCALNYKSKEPWAKYRGWEDSAEDYVKYQTYVLNGKEMSDEEYMYYLKRINYFGDSKTYIAKLKRLVY